MNLYLEVKQEFEKRKDIINAKKMKAYMRNLFDFYGLATVNRRNVYNKYLKIERNNSFIDWTIIDKCFLDPYREMQYFGMDYLLSKQKYLTYDDVLSIRKYIKVKSWWDSIDVFDRIVGDVGLKDRRIDKLMVLWSKDDDFWIRRIAIDHQLNRKEKTNPLLLEEILVNNFGSEEFFINKAIGWALRDYSKTNPVFVRTFIKKHSSKMSKLSVREASKYI